MVDIDANPELVKILVDSAGHLDALERTLVPIKDVLVAAGVGERLASLAWYDTRRRPLLSDEQALAKLDSLAMSPAMAMKHPSDVLYLTRQSERVMTQAVKSPWIRIAIGLEMYDFVCRQESEVEVVFKAYDMGAFEEEASAYQDANPGAMLPCALCAAWIFGQELEHVKAHMVSGVYGSALYRFAVRSIQNAWGWHVRYRALVHVLGEDMDAYGDDGDRDDVDSECRRVAQGLLSQARPARTQIEEAKDLPGVIFPGDGHNKHRWTVENLRWLHALALAHDQKLARVPKQPNEDLDPLLPEDPESAGPLELSKSWATLRG